MRKLFLGGLLLITVIMFTASCSDVSSLNLFSRIKEKLSLTDEQAKAMKPIFDRQIDKAKTLIQDAKKQQNGISVPLTSEAIGNPLMIKLQALSSETKQELTPILTPEQLDTYDEMVSAQLEKYRAQLKDEQSSGAGSGGFGGNMGGYGPSGMNGGY